MNGLFQAADEIGRFLSDRGWQYCIIGGLAVQRWGEPRTTLDIDITLLTGWGAEAGYVDALLGQFEARLSDARAFALERRILLLRSSQGTDIDIALGALPFEDEMVRRAQPVTFAPGIVLPCCTAEDLFIMKAFSGRTRDWVDAESIVLRQTRLDHVYILGHLAALCAAKEDAGTLERAQALLGKSS